MSDAVAGHLIRALNRAAADIGEQEPSGAQQVARRLGIAGFVSRLCAGSGHPPDAERLLTSLSEQLLYEAALEVADVLVRHGVPHFFVKGIALVRRVYQAGDREMADIDLHVAPERRGETVHLLAELGYEPVADSDQDGPAELRPGVVLARGTGVAGLQRVLLDVRWGLDPVERLLPRPDHPVPDAVWEHLDLSGPFPIPSDASHAALLVHHLVHHDMLHIRGLLDLALVWQRLSPPDGVEVAEVARHLRVLRATQTLAEVLAADLSIDTPHGIGPVPRDWRGRRARRLLEPARWYAWAAVTPSPEHVMITPRRLARRVLFLDALGAVPALLADAVRPPREYLEWRWPEASLPGGAWARHVGRLIGKLLAM